MAAPMGYDVWRVFNESEGALNIAHCPAVLARALGESAWRYMQWTRRHHPDALERVRYVRSTMHPYALFDR